MHEYTQLQRAFTTLKTDIDDANRLVEHAKKQLDQAQKAAVKALAIHRKAVTLRPSDPTQADGIYQRAQEVERAAHHDYLSALAHAAQLHRQAAARYQQHINAITAGADPAEIR